MAGATDDRRCPVCGEGTLVQLAFDGETDETVLELAQEADSRQLATYSCGHTEEGPSLASADADRLDVERRDAEESAEPLPTRGDA
jgi:hypothetical protein